MDDEKSEKLPFDPQKVMFQCKGCESFIPGGSVKDIQLDPREIVYRGICPGCGEVATIMIVEIGDPGSVPPSFRASGKRMEDLTIVLEKIVIKLGAVEKELRASNVIEQDRLEFNQWKDVALSIVSKWLRSKKTPQGKDKKIGDFMKMLAENSPDFKAIMEKLKKGEGDGNLEAGGSGVGSSNRAGRKGSGKAGDKTS